MVAKRAVERPRVKGKRRKAEGRLRRRSAIEGVEKGT